LNREGTKSAKAPLSSRREKRSLCPSRLRGEKNHSTA
jgi:hypothetical protein